MKKWLLILLASAVLAGLALSLGTADESSPGRPTRTAGSVVLVILDTVRADHLSACGYARPTSPFARELFSNADFATCQAYSPGSWTLPSHASFFTGLPVEEHGANTVSRGDVMLPWGTRFTPLADRFATLAEKFRKRGYRTVLVSGNPVLSKASGLARGFDYLRVAQSFGRMYGDTLVRDLRSQLRDAPADQALFLVVNISDAHSPWLPIPEDLGWAPPQPGFDVAIHDDNPWMQYVRGTLSPQELERARAHYTDVYDYGVFRADQTLAGVFAAMHDYNMLADDYRIVVTSDHGELLLEHDSFGHGGHLWEASVRVPFAFLSSGTAPGNLGEPFAAIEAHRLLLGEAPLEGPVTATGNRRHRLNAFFGDGYPQFRELAVALWKSKRHKLLKRDDSIELYDIEADPNEMNPLPVRDEHLVERLNDTAGRATENDVSADVSEALLEQLRVLGYAD